jgi:hypothetical protein
MRYSEVDLLCKKFNAVEDECHFLFDCVLYVILRIKHLVPLIDKFIGLNRVDLLA